MRWLVNRSSWIPTASTSISHASTVHAVLGSIGRVATPELRGVIEHRLQNLGQRRNQTDARVAAGRRIQRALGGVERALTRGHGPAQDGRQQ